MDHQTSSVPQISYHSPPVSTQPMTEFPQLESGLAVPMFSQGDDPIACFNKAMDFLSAVAASRVVQQVQGRQEQSYAGTGYKGNATSFGGNNAGGQAKEKAMLAEAQEFGQILDEEQLAFLANPDIPDGQAAQTTIPNTSSFQTEDLDAYDSNCNDVSNAKPVLMANLSNYGSDVISEQIDSLEQNLSNQIKENESLLQTFTVLKNESKEKESKYMDKEIDLENKIKELDNIVYKMGQSAQTVHMLIKPQVFYDDTHKQALAYQNPFYLKKSQLIRPTLYDGSVISSQHTVIPVIDDEETLILEEVSRSKMLAKQNDPISKEKKVNNTLINYVELNRLSKDFGKCFVPQQELSVEQAFWLQTSHPNTDQSASSPVKIKDPKELPKVSLVNTSLNKLKYHLGQFDIVVKKRITPDVITEGEWGIEHTKTVFLNKIIPFLKTLKEIFNVFDKDLLNEVTEVHTAFNQMETAVQQYVMLCVMNSTAVFGDYENLEMKKSESCNKCLDLEAELVKRKNMVEQDKDKSCNNQNTLEIQEYFKNNNLKAQLQAKDTTIWMFKLDLDPLAPRLLKIRDAHIDYLKYTQEQADILRGIVKQAKAKQPLDNALDFACKHADRAGFTP
ncbi:hypothetical protein Tco_0923544 [Tanacetum coccineum]|uniref:Uncharacterized protein n=1 Tax=Tanacetum coccineum TaxID=301880 RepID=A0ABQ5D192_9ASTR